MGARGSGFTPMWRDIIPITDGIRESIARSEALEALSYAKFDQYTTEALVDLAALLRDSEKLPKT